MNFRRFYYGLSRTPILLCMFVALFAGLSAHGYGQQSFFDRFTDDRFIFGRQNEDDTDEDSETEEEYGADEDSETEAERKYDSTKNSGTSEEVNAAGHQTTEAVEQRTNASAEPQTDKPATASTAAPNITTSAKEAASERNYFFRYMHSVHKGARISTGISGRGYIGYLQLESTIPVPYFELSVRNFGVGLYPLAALQSSFSEKHIPTLFLGAGNLTFDTFLKAANFTGYAKTKANYGGLTFPREQFIGIGSTQKPVQYGVEVYGSGWNGVFFASPEPKRQRTRYGLMVGWRMNRKKTDINFALQYLTAFMPELIREVQAPSTINGQDIRQRYHTLFGLNAVFAHPIVSFKATGFVSYAADKTVSGAIQAEADVWYRYAGVRTGGSYTGTRAVNWDGKQQNEQVSAFIQPYFKAGIFSLFALYAFNMENRVMLHNGGLIIKVTHKVIRWKASWDYRNELHTAKTELACVGKPLWFSGVQWFQKAAIGTSVELQDKTVNPFILKKYAIHANGTFCITDGVFCGLSGSFSQKIRKEATNDKRPIYLQSPVYGGGVYVSFKRNGIGKTHSGKLEVSVKSEKPYYDVKLVYQIRGK